MRLGFDESVVEELVEGLVLAFGHRGLKFCAEVWVAVGEDGFGEDGECEAVVGIEVYDMAKLCFDLEDCAWCCLTCGCDSDIFAEHDLREKPVGDGASGLFKGRCIDDARFEGR